MIDDSRLRLYKSQKSAILEGVKAADARLRPPVAAPDWGPFWGLLIGGLQKGLQDAAD